jgi:lycopene cyclase domain-containing protein
MWGKYTYLLLDLITLSPILFLSFDKWVQFYKNWIPSLISIIIIGAIFIVWDVWFTNIGVWEFNYDYLIDVTFINLPLEDWMFFWVVPWVCVFISESLHTHFHKFIYKINFIPSLYILLAGALVGLYFGKGIYTLVNFSVFLVVFVLQLIFMDKQKLNLYALTYLVHLLPFYIVNGVLTGEPIVIYNNAQNLGIRVGTIPIEDFLYSYNLIGLVFLLYFPLKKRFNPAV